jgi:hypothetical protein
VNAQRGRSGRLLFAGWWGGLRIDGLSARADEAADCDAEPNHREYPVHPPQLSGLLSSRDHRPRDAEHERERSVGRPVPSRPDTSPEAHATSVPERGETKPGPPSERPSTRQMIALGTPRCKPCRGAVGATTSSLVTAQSGWGHLGLRRRLARWWLGFVVGKIAERDGLPWPTQ